MSGFTTDFQIIPASTFLAPGHIVQPRDGQDILSILPGYVGVSADTIALIASLARPAPMRLAA